MDWKEQLSTIVDESEIQLLDVRFICMKQQEKWYVKRFRATVFRAEPSTPEQVQYPSYLFLRQKMSAANFLQLIGDLTADKNLTQKAEEHPSQEQPAQGTQEKPPEEQPAQKVEEQFRKFNVNGQEIWFDNININFNDHARGNTLWGLVDRPLPTWNFSGNIWPEIPESQEPLVAPGAQYFPTPIDGQAWYVYEKALQSPNNYLPPVEISLEDERAFFRDVVIDEKTSTVLCKCEGKKLAKATLRLYTNGSQIEDVPARSEVLFRLQGEPKIISLALTYDTIWLDRQDTNLNYLDLGVPRGVKVTGRSLRSVSGGASDSTQEIEAIVRSDSSDLAATAGPHLVLSDRFYNNVLDQSKRSFMWAIVGFVAVFVFIAAAVLLLIFREPGNGTNLASIITALGAVPSGLLAAYLLKLHQGASDKATSSQVNLDRIQRFFIAITVSTHLQEESRDETRVALIKKLNDL